MVVQHSNDTATVTITRLHEKLLDRVLLPLSESATSDLKTNHRRTFELLVAIRAPRAFVASDANTVISRSSRNLVKKNNTMAHKTAIGEPISSSIMQCRARGNRARNGNRRNPRVAAWDGSTGGSTVPTRGFAAPNAGMPSASFVRNGIRWDGWPDRRPGSGHCARSATRSREPRRFRRGRAQTPGERRNRLAPTSCGAGA